MSLNLKPWQLIAIGISTCLLILAGVAWWRMRPLLGVRELARRLPPGEGVVVYIDVAAMRRMGILGLLDDNAAYREKDYRNFVSTTGFDYREDLDGALLAFRGEDRYYLLTGRFAWPKLSDYARGSNGRCLNGQCVMPSSAGQERFISFLQVRPGVMGMAVSRDTFIATQLTSAQYQPNFDIPTEPIWVYLPASMLRTAAGMPQGLGQFLGSLAGAQSATAAVGGTTADFELRLVAKFAGTTTAKRAAEMLTSNTGQLAGILEKEGKKADPQGLTGMLCSGRFEAKGTTVVGKWPLSRTFLETLAGGKVP